MFGFKWIVRQKSAFCKMFWELKTYLTHNLSKQFSFYPISNGRSFINIAALHIFAFLLPYL